MHKVFDSIFENSLRILLLLNEFETEQNIDTIYVTDFISLYGNDFGISQKNLNGDNNYKFSEFASKRQLIQETLKYLVFKELVLVVSDDLGIKYKINEESKTYCETLDSDYANEYRINASKAIGYLNSKSLRAVIKEINSMSLKRDLTVWRDFL